MNRIEKPHIGIIGGLGMPAGIHYYRGLVRGRVAQGVTPRITVAHAHMDIALDAVTRNALDELAADLASLLEQLAGAGATIGAVSAITPHIAIDRIQALSPIPVLSALDAVASAVSQRKLERVSLFGTKYTVESRLFGHLSPEAVVPLPDEHAQQVYDTYLAVARGDENPAHRETLNRIAGALISKHGAQAIVLAGTDLSALYDGHDIPFAHLDASAAHIESLLTL